LDKYVLRNFDAKYEFASALIYCHL